MHSSTFEMFKGQGNSITQVFITDAINMTIKNPEAIKIEQIKNKIVNLSGILLSHNNKTRKIIFQFKQILATLGFGKQIEGKQNQLSAQFLKQILATQNTQKKLKKLLNYLKILAGSIQKPDILSQTLSNSLLKANKNQLFSATLYNHPQKSQKKDHLSYTTPNHEYSKFKKIDSSNYQIKKCLLKTGKPFGFVSTHQKTAKTTFHFPNQQYSTTLQSTDSLLPKQTIELKLKLEQEISYRQRLQKIKSESYLLIKEQYLKKKLEKTKMMNKKVKEIFQKNILKDKQTLNGYKPQTLFQPSMTQQFRIKRGKTANIDYRKNLKVKSLNNSKVDQIPVDSDCLSNYDDIKSKRKIKFCTVSSTNEPKTKNQIITIKSLKSILSKNVKGTVKSFKSIAILKASNAQKSRLEISPAKKSPSKVACAYSFYQKEVSLAQPEHDLNTRIKMAKQKRQKMQKQRQFKAIQQAMRKQRKICTVNARRKRSKQEQVSSRNKSRSESIRASSTKSEVRERIGWDVRKREFLQQRVDKLRQRHQKDKERREQLAQHHQIQNSFTYEVSKIQKDKQQQSIKNMRKQRQNQGKRRQQYIRLRNLTKKQLRKKLKKIEQEQNMIRMKKTGYY